MTADDVVWLGWNGKRLNQTNTVLKILLLRKEGLTARDAMLEFGCYRLAARIAELRDVGWVITTHSETRNGTTFARYKLGGAWGARRDGGAFKEVQMIHALDAAVRRTRERLPDDEAERRRRKGTTRPGATG